MVPSIFGQFTVGGHMNALVRYHSHEGKMTPNSLIFWRVATAKKVHFRLGHAQVICHCDAKQFFGHQYHFSYTQKNLLKLLLLHCFFKKVKIIHVRILHEKCIVAFYLSFMNLKYG